MDCGERWGVFTAGMGVDGDVVAAVEAQRDKGRKVTASRYIRVAIREMLASARREPTLTLHLPDREPVVRRALRVRVELEPVDLRQHPAGLDEPRHDLRDGSRRLRDHQHERLGESGAGAADAGRSKPRIEAKHLIRDDDLPWMRVTADTPVACQIDGDYVGLRETMTFTSVPDALGVVAPPAEKPLTCDIRCQSAANLGRK